MPEETPRWTQYVDVDELRPDPRNPKRHDDDGLDESLARFGFTEPVMVDERTGLLVAGHGRRELVLRARDRGADPPDGIVVALDGKWRVPVQRGWSSENDDEAYAYLIASNRWVERGGWHDRLLAEGLSALRDTPGGLSGVGYNADEIDDFVKAIQPPDLDALAELYGDPDESDLWPVLRFKVSPQTRDRYLALVKGHEGSDADQFDYMLGLAEKATVAV